MILEGTIINAAAIIAGSMLGLAIHSRLPSKIISVTFQAIGLFTLFLGVSMALKTTNLLVMIFSLVIGSVIGEWLNIENYLNRFSRSLKRRFNSGEEKFSEGFVTATLLFCVGSMAILGAIEEGLGGEPNLLLAKSILDGFSSLALASSLGIGVVFSVIPLVLYQGGITLFSSYVHAFVSEAVITELSAVGGILLLGLGISMLEIKAIRVVNMLPSLVVVVILAYFFV